MKNALLYALVCRTPLRFWLERRDVLRWMRRVGMLHKGERRESDWKGAKRPALRICVEECGGALGLQQTVSLFFENLLRNNFAIPEHNFH